MYSNLPSKRASDDRLAVNNAVCFGTQEYIFCEYKLDYVPIENRHLIKDALLDTCDA